MTVRNSHLKHLDKQRRKVPPENNELQTSSEGAEMPINLQKSSNLDFVKTNSNTFVSLSTADYAAFRVNQKLKLVSTARERKKNTQETLLNATMRTTVARFLLKCQQMNTLPRKCIANTSKECNLERRLIDLVDISTIAKKEPISDKQTRGTKNLKSGGSKKKKTICDQCKLQKLDWPFCGLTGELHKID